MSVESRTATKLVVIRKDGSIAGSLGTFTNPGILNERIEALSVEKSTTLYDKLGLRLESKEVEIDLDGEEVVGNPYFQ